MTDLSKLTMEELTAEMNRRGKKVVDGSAPEVEAKITELGLDDKQAGEFRKLVKVKERKLIMDKAKEEGITVPISACIEAAVQHLQDKSQEAVEPEGEEAA